MKKLFTAILLTAIFWGCHAQLPIGTFREWLPKHNFFAVTQSSDYVYAASTGGVLYVDKGSGATNFWSKANGLSEATVTGCYYSENDAVLAITYSNANIDFIKGDKLINLSDIKNKNIVGSKNINNIFFKNGNAYLTCDFGVVVVNLKDFLIKETLFTNQGNGHNVYDMTEMDGVFYIFTNTGVFSLDPSLSTFANFNDWEKVPQFGNGSWNKALNFNSGFIAAKGINTIDSMFLFKNGTLVYLQDISYEKLYSFDTKNDRLLLCNKDSVTLYDSEFSKIFSRKSWWTLEYEEARQAIIDKDDIIWVADTRNGLLKFDASGNKIAYYLDGPYTNQSFRIACDGEVLAIVPGSCAGYNAPHYTEAALSHYIDGHWNRYPRSIIPELFSINATDLCCVAINPRNPNEVYTGSWKDGLFKFVTGQSPTQYTPANSSLQQSSIHAGIADYTLISDLCFDDNNNLWIANAYCTYPLSVLKSDGNWQRFNIGASPSSAIGRICIDSKGYKWIPIQNSDKTWRLVAFNDNNTISNTSDDKIVTANLNDYCNVITSFVNCVAEDLDGKIWIGTEQGIKVIHNAANAFSSLPYAQNILIDANGNLQNLLEFEAITCIAVDDANRKWIGTEKAGVFLVSDDGTEELQHFTTENSPLLSNTVNDIAINRLNGEVFFATPMGTVSYRGTATEGKEDFSNIRVFPNPVKDGYNGIIAITGLMQNSFCKIADAAGHLVWQGYADGGQLNWNGKDLYGNRPATGVYYVFASDKTGKIKKVAKLLFIK